MYFWWKITVNSTLSSRSLLLSRVRCWVFILVFVVVLTGKSVFVVGGGVTTEGSQDRALPRYNQRIFFLCIFMCILNSSVTKFLNFCAASVWAHSVVRFGEGRVDKKNQYMLSFSMAHTQMISCWDSKWFTSDLYLIPCLGCRHIFFQCCEFTFVAFVLLIYGLLI